MSDEIQAWGYVRLSQRGRDGTLEEQKRQIREYARKRDRLTLATTLNEGSETSGFDSGREKYQRLLKNVRDGNVDAVIVRDRSRLSRDFDERLRLILTFRTKHSIRQKGGRTVAVQPELHVTEESRRIDMSDSYTSAMECMHAAMDHVKKMTEIERAKEAVEERKESGCYQGRPPFGLVFDDDNCHLKRDGDQWDVVKEIIHRRKDGESVASIAEDVSVSQATIRRVENNGIEWYLDRLEEYGK